MGDCQHCIPCALKRIEKSLVKVLRATSRMEITMARETDALNDIKAKLADVHDDVRAKLDQVRAELSPEGQQAIDEVAQALEAFDAEIGDADGSDTPTRGGLPGGGVEDQPTGDGTGEDLQPTA